MPFVWRPSPSAKAKRSALKLQRVRILVHYSMFVRWQTYPSQALNFWHAKHNDRRARLKAVLVESVRVDGKPRQKHIAFLGSIQSDDLDKASRYFWRNVTLKLKRLGNRVSPEDYERIIASLAAKVAGRPLADEELERMEREREAFLGGIAAELAPYRRAPRPPRRQRPLRDRVEEAGRKYVELRLQLDRETIAAALSPPAKGDKRARR